MTLSDEKMRERMQNGWRAGQPFTECGNGSLPQNTKNIREWLPRMCHKYHIETINDAGAGDMAWMRGMEWEVGYRPFDLIPRSPEVIQCDITTQVLPRADAIICRMVLNHLADDPDRIQAAIDNFIASDATYLIATHFVPTDRPDPTPAFQRVDLTQYLGKYEAFATDGNEPHCRLALWVIN